MVARYKKSLFSLILVLLILPMVYASVSTTVTINANPGLNLTIIVSSTADQMPLIPGGEFPEIPTDDTGKAVITVNSADQREVYFSITARNQGSIVGGIKKFGNYTLGIPIIIDLFGQPIVTPPVVPETPVENITPVVETTPELSPPLTSPTGNIIGESSTTKKNIFSNLIKGRTPYIISGILLAILIAGAIFFFMRSGRLGHETTYIQPRVIKQTVDISDNELTEVEKKIEETKRELDDIKNKRKRYSDAQQKFSDAQKELDNAKNDL